MDAANNLWIPALTCLSILFFLAVLFIFATKAQKKMQASWREVEEQLGLLNHQPDQVYPELKGKIDGIEVAVDIIQQEYSRGATPGSGRSSTGQRPWTRVRAQLTEKPTFQARSRHQKYDEAIEWPMRKTGDADLDEKYEIFIPEDVPLDEALPPPVRSALLAANPPIHVLKKVVLWTKIKVVRDPELLKSVVQSCVNVANAIDPSDW